MVEQSKKFSNGSRGGDVVPTEIMERSSFSESQAKGETDMQIATAKRYPRSIKRAQETAMSLATLDESTAESMFYVLPARGEDSKPIEGPSVRLAEIVAGAWTNMRVKTSIVDDDGKFVTAQGMAWDLESNLCVCMDVRRSVTKKNGQRYGADMIAVTANAACSIAYRNAVFKVIPKALVDQIYLAAKKVAIGDASSLSQNRAKAIDGFGKMGISPDRVCLYLNRGGVADITLDDIGILRGLYTAIRDGEATIDEAFPKPAPKSIATEEDKAKLAAALADLNAQNGKGDQKAEENPQEDSTPHIDYRAELLYRVERTNDAVELQNIVDEARDRWEEGVLTAEGEKEISEAIKAKGKKK